MNSTRLVLASASPRRAELLTAAGVRFVAAPVDVDESPLPNERPADYVERLARMKAASGLRIYPEHVVLGADTTVVIDDTILAKPADDADAARMLRQLSGRAHEVLTGLAVKTAAAERTALVRTTVWMSPLTAADIAWYIASGEPRDKAGAYAIQGLASRFVPRIEGSYSNVVGLPVAALFALLREIGADGLF